ncbi:glycosyltransferase [Marinobacter santoriniensis NKSG1]|uniref:Glycosyltransferase n=1 Tax=Marinobacter santoriniensis NKSG1 TaxID=1288826 RepID=M7CK29_9GAMM|nr:glycosyltransferase family 4 protein [Marinobacter santoriniensis]EMP54021.1 glycosyltransferase [Marinobacter santoriniensis NKSG1]
MKVAMILGTPGTGWGGMEKHTAELAAALSTLGHEIHVLAHESYRPRFAEDLTFHPVPINLGRRNPWLRHRIRRILEQIAPDVAHAQGSKAADILGRLRLPANCQTVGTLHGSKSTDAPFRRLDKVIAVSQSLYDNLSHPHRFLVFNGTEWSGDRSLPPGFWPPNWSSGHLNAIAAGRLEPVKGFESLILAWQNVLERFPTAHLTIFGEGSQKDRLGSLIRERALTSAITLAGARGSLSGAYGLADLTVISSEREGFPYVLVEALLEQCPVVSTPVSGCTELLPPKAIARDHSHPALAECIVSAFSSLEELRAQEQKAFVFARANLTARAMAEATLEAYLAA